MSEFLESVSPEKAALTAFWILWFLIGIIIVFWAIPKSRISLWGLTLVMPDIKRKLVAILVGLLGISLASSGLFGFWHTVVRLPTLIVLTGLEEDELTFFEKSLVGDFEEMIERETHEKIKVQVENVEWTETLRRLMDGETIDLITFDVNGWRQALVENNLIEDLSDSRELIPSSVHPVLMKTLLMKDTRHRGKRYFIPYRPNVRLVFLNRKKYAELMLGHQAFRRSPDTLDTWSDLKEFLSQLSEKEREDGAIFNIKGIDAALFLLDFIRSAGGDPLNLLDSVSMEAAESLHVLLQYISPKSKEVNWQSASGYFLSGSVCLARNWTMQLSDIHEAGMDSRFDVYPGWRWEGRTPSYLLGGEVLALPRTAAHRKLAEELIRFLVSKDVQREIVAKLSWPAMRLDALGESKEWQRGYLETINEALLHAEPVPDYWWPNVAGIYERAFYALTQLESGADLQNTLQSFQDQLDLEVERLALRPPP